MPDLGSLPDAPTSSDSCHTVRHRPYTVVFVLSFPECIQIGTNSVLASAGGAGVSFFPCQILAISLQLGKCGVGLNRWLDQAWHHKVLQSMIALTSNSLF